MKLRLFALMVVCIAFSGINTTAQDTIFISLNIETTELQTGQEYEITILAENVTNLWGSDLSIRYNPTNLYVIGTRSGSPISQGNFIGDAPTLIVRNGVEDDLVRYTISRLGSAVEPVSGTGAIGTFRIYPLAPGTTQITFANAQLSAITGEQDGERTTGAIDFTPILLELNITGDPVPPPPEITATPNPTPTSIIEAVESTAEPTESDIVNVTRAPTEVPTDVEVASGDSGSSSLLFVAIGFVIVGIIGLVVLFLIWRRNQQ